MLTVRASEQDYLYLYLFIYLVEEGAYYDQITLKTARQVRKGMSSTFVYSFQKILRYCPPASLPTKTTTTTKTKNQKDRSCKLTLFSLGGGGHIVPALTLTNYNF